MTQSTESLNLSDNKNKIFPSYYKVVKELKNNTVF